MRGARYGLAVMVLVSSLTGPAGLRPAAVLAHALPAPSGVSESAPIGSVVTATVAIDNTGQAASEALLYEALPAPEAAAYRVLAPLRVPIPDSIQPIDPDLEAALQIAPDGQAEMIIFLADQADLSAAAAIPDWNARGAAVVAALQAQAAASQPDLLAALTAARYAPHPYWIVNAVGVRGDAALAQWLAARPEVAVVAADYVHALETDTSTTAQVGNDAPAWGVAQVHAPSVWDDWGVRGAGIVVANIDTGVALTHTALLTRYRGWSPGGVVNNYNWFDAAGQPAAVGPIDTTGHGSHTMGSIVGGAAGGYSDLGVAPGARWIAARACIGLFCNDAALLTAAQWLLAPTNAAGLNPRPDLRPHIISNSWGKNATDPWYLGYVTAWNAAGIFSVFAAGNSGATNYCGSANAPGNYAESYAVGATDASDIIATFSSRGPTADNRIKPDMSAPGVNVPSAWWDGSVRLLSGTSMATPHVAGVVALLWSANPTLIGDLPATQALLNNSAVHLPTAECGTGPATVPNNVYGWGRVDAAQAVQAGRVDVPWLTLPPTLTLPMNAIKKFQIVLDGRQVSAPGTYVARILVAQNGGLTPITVTFEVLPAAGTALLTGTLVDAWYGQPVYGHVLVAPGPQLTTDLSGHFTATLPFGNYGLTVSAAGHFSATAGLPFTAAANIELPLIPQLPRLQVTPPPISATLDFGEQYNAPIAITNGGTRPLSVTVSVPADEWIVTAAGEPGATLYDLSASPPLTLTDDQIYPTPLALGFEAPINGVVVNQVYLSSNGWVSASKATNPAPLADCLPSGTLAPGTLAGFWTDLDPSEGGAVRAAAVDAETYVISFEGVPRWQESAAPPAPTYTFQIALHADGEIEFLFGAMGPLPDRWGVGMGYDLLRGQGLTCYKEPVDLAGTVWRMYNQPLPAHWLTADPAALLIAPGDTATLTARLVGFGYVPWRPAPYVGRLHLSTNDPGHATQELTATASIGPPAAMLYFPLVWMRH